MTINSIDIAVSFDTTGSMYPCITEVRRKMVDMVGRLFIGIPGLRMAIIAHGDYCDDKHPYVTKVFNFSSDKHAIMDFINKVENTSGGDSDECYELVLNQVRSLDWQSGKSKAFVMIGDAEPHRVGYRYSSFTNTLSWENEAQLLSEAGIKIYSCHAMASIRRSSHYFYNKLADIGKGYYVTLEQFSSLPNLLMGIFYNQNSPEQFVSFAKDIDAKGQISRDLHTSFTAMGATDLTPMKEYARDTEYRGAYTGRSSSSSRTFTSGSSHVKEISKDLKPVPASRFQVFNIDTKQSIRTFVENQHTMFKPGRGFYQLTKSVKVQQYKEIVLVDKRTKDIFTGGPVRELLGLRPQTISGGVTERLSSHSTLFDYDVFIQSTSYNRELLPGTLFMYEVDGWDSDLVDTKTPITEAVKKVEERIKEGLKKGKVEPMPVFPSGASLKYKSEVKVAVTTTSKPIIGPCILPLSLEKGKKAFDSRTEYPGRPWSFIADNCGFGSASGAQKAAKRYEKWHIENQAARKALEIREEKKKHRERLKEASKELKIKKIVDTIAIVLTDNMKKARTVYQFKKARPDSPWDTIASLTGYISGSGARKAAKRYEAFANENGLEK